MNLSGFDKKIQLQSCSPQKSMRFKKKVSKLLFSFKSYEHLYFRARPVNNRVKFGGFDKKLNYKVVALENICSLEKRQKRLTNIS